MGVIIEKDTYNKHDIDSYTKAVLDSLLADIDPLHNRDELYSKCVNDKVFIKQCYKDNITVLDCSWYMINKHILAFNSNQG